MDSDSDLAAATAARSVQVLTAVSMLAENLVRARQYSTYAQADRDAAAARSHRAQRLAEHGTARVAYGFTGDRGWARTATVVDAARAWRTAHEWAGRDPAANIAQHRAEALLRRRSPAAMQHYDSLRARGADALTAMQGAAPLFLAAPTLPAALATDAAARAEAGADHARADALRATPDMVITSADEAGGGAARKAGGAARPAAGADCRAHQRRGLAGLASRRRALPQLLL